jgi:hypothetical protein
MIVIIAGLCAGPAPATGLLPAAASPPPHPVTAATSGSGTIGEGAGHV